MRRCSHRKLPSHQAIQNGLKISEKLHLVQQHIVLILVVNASCDIFADSAFLSILYELKFCTTCKRNAKRGSSLKLILKNECIFAHLTYAFINWSRKYQRVWVLYFFCNLNSIIISDIPLSILTGKTAYTKTDIFPFQAYMFHIMTWSFCSLYKLFRKYIGITLCSKTCRNR